MNWISNFDAFRVNYPKVASAQVHQGFYNAYLGVQSQVYSGLKTALASCPGCEIRCTGHSLGAALATIAAADLVQNFKTSSHITLYNFGSPRVGNQAFATWLQGQVPT